MQIVPHQCISKVRDKICSGAGLERERRCTELFEGEKLKCIWQLCSCKNKTPPTHTK